MIDKAKVAAAGGLLLAMSPGAMAQQAAEQAAPAESTSGAQPSASGQASDDAVHSDSVLSDIVVTAQRRAERSQSVPISVSALSATALSQANVRSLQDLSASIPGFVATTTTGNGAAPLSIRGVGGANGGDNFFADEPVATYVDGVYVGRQSVATSDIVDLEGVQVLRGPQGTLYGRNSTAGAVLVTTARPTREFQARGEGGYNSLGDWRVESAVSGPLVTDRILARVAAAYGERGGFGRNVVTGEQVGRGHSLTLRGSLRILPTNTITIDIIGEHFTQRAEPALIHLARITGGTTDTPLVLRPDIGAALDHSLYAFNTDTYSKIKNDALTATLEWSPGGVVINSITGYRKFNVRGQQDTDNVSPAELTGGPLSNYSNVAFFNSQFTQELRVSSPSATAPLFYTAGIFYIHENNRIRPVNIYNAQGYFGLGTHAAFNSHQNLDAVAGFADVSLRLGEKLTLRGGARYSYENKKFDVNQRVVNLVQGFSPPLGMVIPTGTAVVAPPTFVADATFKNFTVRAVADYKVSRDVLLYASFSQGFKSGGFNAFGLQPAFRPEKINAYEIGVKSELFDRILRLNIDGFHYDYKDLQVRLPIPTGGINITNVKAAKVDGIELETALVPMQGLKLSATAAYIDARFTEGMLPQVPNGALFKLGTNVPLVQTDVSGNALSRAPKWQASFASDYSTSIGDGKKISFNLNYRYQSNVFYLETNQDAPTYRSGAWGELGARVSLASETDSWSITVFGDNLTNDRHVTAVKTLNAFPFGTVNDPRRVGVRAAFNF